MRIPAMIQTTAALEIANVEDGETIYQRCLLIKGRSPSYEEYGDHLLVTVKDAFGDSSPVQTWPISKGYFKALVMLSPGHNTVLLERRHNNLAKESSILDLNYTPLLQVPPLHLAIMVAKDSQLLMDCPSYKAGGLSSAHSDLDAATAKLRIAAYMWQALTADDMHSKGLGRRSFRLEEEYAIDTTNRTSIRYRQDRSKHMGTVAKVHHVRSEKTVAELLDPNVAQQNERGRQRDALHKYFENALEAHGGVFQSSTRPIVAGLILDSAYSPEQDLLLGHAALGRHNPNGLSLGVFGSHLCYSWPRFFDEIPACLTDTTPPGGSVCNDNGECETAWEAASIGQGAFLHEVGHAFGAPHTTGIMARGYAQDWPKTFLAETAYCASTKRDGATVIDGVTPNDARWDLRDALAFKFQPHFRLPGDPKFTGEEKDALPSIRPPSEETDLNDTILVGCKAGIARITITQNNAPEVLEYDLSLTVPSDIPITLKLDEYDRSSPLSIGALGKNGRLRKIADVWKLLPTKSFVRIHNSDIILQKRSAKRSATARRDEDNDDTDTEMDEDDDDVDGENKHYWAVMLNERGQDGRLSRAKAVDLRVGCILDGAVVYFADGHTTPCGPRFDPDGNEHTFGGHQSEKLRIPQDTEITKFEVNVGEGWGSSILGGIRMTLSNGTKGGALNTRGRGEEDGVTVLEAGEGETIVGFFGASQSWGYMTEFGILTAPKGVELPPQTYDMPELQNIQEA